MLFMNQSTVMTVLVVLAALCVVGSFVYALRRYLKVFRQAGLGQSFKIKDPYHYDLTIYPNSPNNDPLKPATYDATLQMVRAAADAGNTEMMFQEGLIQLYGVVGDIDKQFKGTPDRALAKKYFKILADKGDARACYELHWLYGGVYLAPGLPASSQTREDLAEAQRYLDKALAKKDPYALGLVKRAYEGITKQYDEKPTYELAMSIAEFHFNGRHVPRNYAVGQQWLMKARALDPVRFDHWVASQKGKGHRKNGRGR